MMPNRWTANALLRERAEKAEDENANLKENMKMLYDWIVLYDEEVNKLTAELAEAKKQREGLSLCNDLGDALNDKLVVENTKLLDALTPFVEVWEKRSGPNQPSISSEMLVAAHVKHFIHAKTLIDNRTYSWKPPFRSKGK